MQRVSYGEGLTPQRFYADFVSQSLPLQLKGYCSDWAITYNVQTALHQDARLENSRQHFEELLVDMFDAR